MFAGFGIHLLGVAALRSVIKGAGMLRSAIGLGVLVALSLPEYERGDHSSG